MPLKWKPTKDPLLRGDCKEGVRPPVPKATGYGNLELGRCPRTPSHFFSLDAQPGRVLGAKPAPLLADTGLHRP